MNEPQDPFDIMIGAHLTELSRDKSPEACARAFADITTRLGGEFEAGAVAMRKMADQDAHLRELAGQLRKLVEQIAQRAIYCRVLGAARQVPVNDQTRTVVDVAPLGRESEAPRPAALLAEDLFDPPLSIFECVLVSEGNIILARVEEPALLAHEECGIVRAVPEAGSNGCRYGLVVVSNGHGKEGPYRELPARVETASDILKRLQAGEHIRAQVAGGFVTGAVAAEAALQTREAFEVEIDPHGPRLAELIQRERIRREEWADVERIVNGRGFAVLRIGLTGAGKTEGVYRIAREAGLKANKTAMLILIEKGTVGSAYKDETAVAIRRAARRAVHYKQRGDCLPIVLFDECDQYLGAPAGRHEAHFNMAERLAAQQALDLLKANDIPVYATSNNMSDRWMEPQVRRRFKTRDFTQPPTLSQMRAICRHYAQSHVAKRLGMTVEELSHRVTDYLFADDFQVAVLHYMSGRKQSVRARDLHLCCPAKVQQLMNELESMVLDERAAALAPLYARIHEEFSAKTILSVSNCFEFLHLSKPVNDAVRDIEFLS